LVARAAADAAVPATNWRLSILFSPWKVLLRLDPGQPRFLCAGS
jgi:hypothetical protein